jgi:hypothetical protein
MLTEQQPEIGLSMHWTSKLASVGAPGQKHQPKPNPKGGGDSNAYQELCGLLRTPCGGGAGNAAGCSMKKSPS